MSTANCAKCDELASALNSNLRRATVGDTGASMAVTKVAAAMRFHRTRCAVCQASGSKSRDQRSRTRAA